MSDEWTDLEVLEHLRVSLSKAAREIKDGVGPVSIQWAELQTAANYADRYLKTGVFGPEPDPPSGLQVDSPPSDEAR